MSLKNKIKICLQNINEHFNCHLNPELRYLPGYPNSMSLGHIKTIYYLDFKNCHGKYWYYKLTQNY